MITTRSGNNSSMKVSGDDGKKLLYEVNEVPKGLREPFIQSGYRRPYSTPWQCFKSLFYISNETFNVWSHLLTTSFFVVRYSMAFYHQAYSFSDPFIWPLLSSAIGTLTMYFTSSIATSRYLTDKKSPRHSLRLFLTSVLTGFLGSCWNPLE